MTHRKGLKAAALAVGVLTAGALAGCAGGGGESSDVLRVTLANHVWTDIIKDKIPEFEEETGLTVELTQLGEDQLSDQYNVKLNAGTDEIDVMMYRPLQEGKLFAQNGYLADLTDRAEGAEDWDWSDFQAGPVEATSYEDTVVGVPLITESEVLYYRTDLLEAAGLEVPTTLDELENAAKVISEANPGTAGFIARTGKSAAVTQFSSYLFSFGGDFSDGDSATVNSPEAVEAYEYYGGLINKYGPENVSTDMNWAEASAIFAQGQAAFYTDASSLYQNMALPENSTVSDKLGYAPFPEGPAGSKPYSIPAWALGINADSPNQDNAWQFIEWATSFDTVLATQEEGVPGARASVWADPAGTASFPPALAEAINANAENGVGYDRPQVVNVAEAREIVGDPIVVGITGGDVAGAAESAEEKFQAFLDDENQ
ncbi:ABC transporter substrate-binding protein [Agromyces aerolatus]|uniref:ABC transporter substrate-binding protein n=1 Tax=Agromyces sp. LY-1074 TaxID=3074080 RepID=UPI0028574DE1|nr:MULTISPECIES: sugar ABC transporter substrate-binding protein [unclassified Agromyces]MDR5701108.1 sugar ABC transporter substrate-binding protein [Agromyces sp. LY-1074]MDR5707748.1 sugar ABC transporter substrate-binding protein [Agromyces sp. LY-1358]